MSQPSNATSSTSTVEKNSVASTIRQARKKVDEYVEFVGLIYGFTSLSMALGAVSTNSPRLFASIGLLFIVTYFAGNVGRYRRPLKLLETIKDPSVSMRVMLPRLSVPIIGLLVLALVAFGMLNTDGVRW